MALIYYYNANAEGDAPKVVDKNWVAIYGGVNPDESTPEELAEKGFYKYNSAPVPVYNPRIFCLKTELNVEGTEATPTFTVESLPLAESKSSYMEEVDSKAYSILLPTDWLIVRQAETGAEVPPELLSWRSEVRTSSQMKKDSIEGCKTAKKLESYVNSEDFYFWPPKPQG